MNGNSVNLTNNITSRQLEDEVASLKKELEVAKSAGGGGGGGGGAPPPPPPPPAAPAGGGGKNAGFQTFGRRVIP